MSSGNPIQRIVFTGPESTGKSFLAHQLAWDFDTVWNPEYARFYLSRLKRPYVQSDILNIAKGQIFWEDIWAQHANKFLFCDTALIVPKIWSLFKYGWVSPELLKLGVNRPYHLFFLCAPDLPWSYDPLRENPNDRVQLFEMYEHELKANSLPYFVLTGDLQNRRQTVMKILKNRDVLV